MPKRYILNSVHSRHRFPGVQVAHDKQQSGREAQPDALLAHVARSILEGGSETFYSPPFLSCGSDIVIDDTSCWHVGCSIKDAGNRAFMLSAIEDTRNAKALLNILRRTWAGAPLLV